MKKQFGSQPGRFNLRLLTGSVLLAIGILTLAGTFGLRATAKNDPFRAVPTVAAPAVGRTQTQTKATTNLPSKRYNLEVDLSQVTYNLGPLHLNSVTPKELNQIGVSRSTELSSTTEGQRFNNPDGTRILLLVIKSPDAVGIRVHFDHFELPAGDEVYVYGSSSDNTAAGPYRGEGPWKNQEFWSATIEGDTAIIEYYIRGSGGYFNIPGISHIYRKEQTRPLFPDVLGCEIDASCNSQTVMNGVGRITFVKNGNSFVCTGTLLNDRGQDFIPYFLTANHCVSAQNVAQTVETYWFYQTTACNSQVLRSDIVHSTNGANLLATDTSKDFTLLRLVDPAPAGTYFSGWTSDPIALNTPVYGFHHPGGDIPPGLASFLRRADGTVNNTSYSCPASGLLSAYRVTWTSGTTEPGSSGSGLWSSGLLAGVLSCGPDVPTCTSPYATYSKFADFYPLIQPYIDPQTVHPAFFNGETALGGGWYYLQFANGTPFGYYSYLSDPHFIYHLDLGFEYLIDANDANHGIYFYDFASSSFFYTSPTLFPDLYDFSLNAWLYYLPDASNPGRYSHNPRWFFNFATGQWITL